jgi:hypothetical protein
MSLADNIARIQDRLAAACARAGRHPADVTLVAISKTFSAEAILETYRLGLRHFGENRIEEAESKISNVEGQISNLQPPISNLQPPISNLQSEITWHLVGHLQSRKARQAVECFDMIHSVDSVKLASKLSRLCVERGRVAPILLECNVSGEASKAGFRVTNAAERAGWLAEVETLLALPGVRVEGLMTVAPLAAAPNAARPFFRTLRELRDQARARWPQSEWRHLSMGMTDDFEVALEEGATLVRIGRAIFGERR